MQEYINADQNIHQLSQIIAKANRTFVPKESDDSHTNLYYDPVGERLLGRWINTNDEKIILALDLNAFQFEMINDSLHVLQAFAIAGKMSGQLESEIAVALAKLGLDSSSFANELDFKIAKYDFKDYAYINLSETALRPWKKYRKLANEASLHLLGYLQSESEIRIWPHHFDTGVYTEVNDHISIGFGLAMADGMEPSPYFYLSGYALGDKELKFDHLPGLKSGRWEIGEYWKGAILPLDNLHTLKENDLSEAIYDFIIGGCKLYLHQ